MKYLKIFFNFISFLSIIYLSYIFYDDLSEINFLNLKFIASLIQSVFFSMIAYFFMYQSFLTICKQFKKDLLFSQVFILMSTSQLFKYIPGNFFHYLKRYEFFKNLGLEKDFIKVNSYELFLYILSSFIFIPIIFTNNLSYVFIFIFLLFFVLIFIPIKKFLKEIFLFYFLAHLFFLISFLVIFKTNEFTSSFYEIINIGSIFTISKVIGTLVPGSPSGLGVSELFVFVTEFDFMLLSMIIFRVVSLSSEILLFLLSFFYCRISSNN